MERILRLSIANIKKHKKQTALLGLLIMFCMAITASAAAGWADISSIFPNVAEEYAVHKNAFYFAESIYDDGYIDLLKEDERVTDVEHISAIYTLNTYYLNKNGKEQALYMSFVTMDAHLRIETSPIETPFSETEISAMEHPVYLPFGARDALGSKFSAGDTFDVVYGSKLFSFTIAGFYESYFFPETNNGYQCIVTDRDYITLMNVMENYEVLLYDCEPLEETPDIEQQFKKRVEDRIGKDLGTSNEMDFSYVSQRKFSTKMINIILEIMLFMAAVIFIASIVMIRFRIAGDIQDQIQSIGVLEALGYTSKDICLAYTTEYLLVALAGIIAGTIGTFFLIPQLHVLGEKLAGHYGSCHIEILPVLLTALGILLFVGLIAYIRSGMVKKYPPVRAFRKGIATHHFGKNPLPLRNTKKSVHLRLAMKGFIQSIRENVGLTACISIASMAAVACLITTDMFGSDFSAIKNLVGGELSDLCISTAPYADTDEFAESLRNMEEVRKVLPGTFVMDISVLRSVYLFDHTEQGFPVSYESFDECENIRAIEGHLPIHDNEIGISKMAASEYGLKVGDEIELEMNKVKKNYIVTCTVPSILNGGRGIYITHDGMRRLEPTFRSHVLDVYLKDGVDKEAFTQKILNIYGKTIIDTRKTESGGDTAEDRIRSAADQKMAELLANYNVNHIEYAVQIGDTVISGSSGGFIIKSISNLVDVAVTQMGGMFRAIASASWVFLAVSGVVVAVIIVNIMEQTIRRQRKELGIMLSMGYTSKELMLQLALRIMPAAIIAVILGTFLGIGCYSFFMTLFFGGLEVNVSMMICAAIIMIIFCFISGYFGAHRIKTISVTELMTE